MIILQYAIYDINNKQKKIKELNCSFVICSSTKNNHVFLPPPQLLQQNDVLNLVA